MVSWYLHVAQLGRDHGGRRVVCLTPSEAPWGSLSQWTTGEKVIYVHNWIMYMYVYTYIYIYMYIHISLFLNMGNPIVNLPFGNGLFLGCSHSLCIYSIYIYIYNYYIHMRILPWLPAGKAILEGISLSCILYWLGFDGICVCKQQLDSDAIFPHFPRWLHCWTACCGAQGSFSTAPPLGWYLVWGWSYTTLSISCKFPYWLYNPRELNILLP